MEPWEFILVTRQGSLGVGLFENHEWHKKEKENIVKSCGLKIEYGEPTEKAKDMGTFKTVTSEEHMKIIAMYSRKHRHESNKREAREEQPNRVNPYS